MEKSFVGDPVQWPGLVYSPLNTPGLLFALGAAAASKGFLFEEFSSDGRTAVCRQKTERGWEKIRVGLALRSSDYDDPGDEIDLLICWLDDSSEAKTRPCLAISQMAVSSRDNNDVPTAQPAKSLESILPEGAAQDLLERGRSHESYEETIKLLD